MCDRVFRMSVVGVCLAIASLATGSVVAGQELRPNLRALPPSNLSIIPNSATGNPELRLSATSWNSGSGPLELVAGAGGQAGQDVYQRIYSQGGGFTDYLAGTFVFHPEHNHFHFERYAVYMLRPVNAPGASQRQSYKTSFCIMDTTKVDARLPGAPNKAVYGGCNAVVQGMSVGWGDTYGWQLAGQAIDLTGNPDGQYELTVAFDPDNRLLETNDADNTACVLLSISVVNRTVQTLGAFLRIVTHPRVSLNPLSAQDADSFIESWLTAPATWVPPAGEGTLAAYRFLATRHSITGNLVPDAMLAALALENGVPVVSADSDFSRFREVAWLNPLRT